MRTQASRRRGARIVGRAFSRYARPTPKDAAPVPVPNPDYPGFQGPTPLPDSLEASLAKLEEEQGGRADLWPPHVGRWGGILGAAAAFVLYAADAKAQVSRPDGAAIIGSTYDQYFAGPTYSEPTLFSFPNPDYGVSGGYREGDTDIELDFVSRAFLRHETALRPPYDICSLTQPWAVVWIVYDNPASPIAPGGLTEAGYLDLRFFEEGIGEYVILEIPQTNDPTAIRQQADALMQTLFVCVPTGVEGTPWGTVKALYK